MLSILLYLYNALFQCKMGSKRYIFRYKGSPEKADQEFKALVAKSKAKVVEHTPTMFLADVSPSVIETIKQVFTNWWVIPETTTSLPDTRVKI